MTASDSDHSTLAAPPPGWVPWKATQEVWNLLPGCRERVVAEAWFDRLENRLVLAIHQYDESLHQFVPCWAQIALHEIGPFCARAEVRSLAELFADTVTECWGLPG